MTGESVPLMPVLSSVLGSVVLAGASGWLAASGAVHRLPGVLNRPSEVVSGPGPAVSRPPVSASTALRGRWLGGYRLLLAGCVPVALAVGAVAGSVPAALLVLLAGVLLERHLRAGRRSWEEAARRAAVLVLCTATVSELRAGRGPLDALRCAAAECGDPADRGPAGETRGPAGETRGPAGETRGPAGEMSRRLRVTADYGANYGRDVPSALGELATMPGAEGLCRLAACWRVAESTGASLATAVERVANGLRDEEAARREVAAQLAAPRATARLLAVLPLFGLLLAAGLGADPLHVLLGTPYGLACLGLGLVLDLAGVAWTERIASAAERTP